MRTVSKKNHGVVLFVIQSSLFILIVATGLIGVFMTSVFRVKADVVTVFPAIHSVIGSKSEDEQSSVQYELVWNNFSIVVPNEASIHNTFLKFSWSFLDEMNEVLPEVMIDDGKDVATSSEDILEDVEQGFPPELEIPLDEFGEISSSSSAVEELLTPENPDVDEVQMVPESLPEPVHETEENLDVPAVPISYGVYLLALEQIEIDVESVATEIYTEVVDDIANQIVAEEVITETSSSSNPDTTTSSVDAAHDITVFEVLYSVDGVQWQNIGFGNFDTPGELTFPLQQFSPDDMSYLQIMVRYTRTTDDTRKIYFDGVRLEFDYESLAGEEVPGLVDQEPNFTISSTKVDIESGNIRAVLLEKGGMVELWYALTNPATGQVLWNRLANDGSVDAASPLGIHGETIFWLDKNQQTIFGFDIKQKSLSGTSFVSDDDRDSLLQFKTENSELWNARFNSTNNSFEFFKQSKTQ